MSESTIEQWEAWEEGEWRHVDGVRVLGYTLVACNDVTEAQQDLEKAVTALARARTKAERALMRRNAVLEHAEAMARVATGRDAEWFAEVASCLEGLFG